MNESFTDVDLGRLEEHWLAQPKLFSKYSKRLANAKKDTSEVKAELEVVEAEMMQAIRSNPRKYGLKKVTEGSIKEALLLTKKRQQAQANLIETKHAEDVLQAVVNTLEHRKRTLENLVTLYGQSYFAKPTLKKGENDKFASKMNDDSINSSFKRKRKNNRSEE